MRVGYCESEYEAATLNLLEAEGWLCSRGDELHRKYSDTILEEDLNAFLCRRYPDFTGEERSRVVFNLRNTGGNTDYLALRSVGQLCLNGFVFDRDDASLPSRQVDYIDFERPDQNIFRAVSQLTVRELGAERRPDVLLYVNGIPLCIIELKNPAQRQASISSAWEQIHIRYKRDIPSLMKFCLLSVISDGGSTRLGTTCAPFEHYYAWKKRGERSLRTRRASVARKGGFGSGAAPRDRQGFCVFPGCAGRSAAGAGNRLPLSAVLRRQKALCEHSDAPSQQGRRRERRHLLRRNRMRQDLNDAFSRSAPHQADVARTDNSHHRRQRRPRDAGREAL